MERRAFLAAAAALVAAPRAAEAQQAGKVPRIGYLAFNLAASPHLHEAFRQGLRDLGYVEGRNIVIEYRDTEGKFLAPYVTGTEATRGVPAAGGR
jgi:putative ABC transport system substrate-binding protein